VQGAICRRFNWKESARTQLTTKTRNALFVFEALPPVSREIVVAAINDLAALIEQYAHGQVSIDILDAHNPAVLLKSEKKYLTLQPHTTIPEDIVISLSAPNMNLQESAKLDLGIQSAAEKTLSHGTVPLDESHIRIGKVQELRKQNIEPWPHAEQVTGTAEQVHKEYDADIQRSYALAGRIMSCRAHGKAIFIHIQDQTGRMQLYIKQDVVGEETFSRVKHFFDIGDIIWAQGYAFKTKTGEITLHVERCLLLSKSLHPLPEKFHGLTDVEVRYRQRYLDLITHQEVRERFIKRSSILRLLRSYLDAHDFLEVETPMLHPIPGGAAARPFVTHHNTLDSDFYLRIAPELYLKRLVIGGFERVYEINRNFRNEGVSTRHNPEFTMLEFYWAHRDYHFIMQFLESMIKDIVMKVCGTLSIPFGDYDLDFSAPFDRLNVHQILMKYGNFTKEQLSEEVLDDTLRTANVKVINKSSSYAQKLFLLFEETCEKKIIQPTFLIDFPIEISPLAKRDVHNPSLAARFELFIAGMEISNGFNELNDPFDQAERFKEQVQAHTAGDEEAHHYDADYITALEYGLPPTVGVGIGIDRLIMLLTNTTSIKEVILFPTLKRKA
jgi:lysyl-tRNA synthetase class 2